METGEIEANLLRLNERFRLAHIDELIAIKVNGEAVALEEDSRYLAEIKALEPRLNAAFECSHLPLTVLPETWQAVKDFLLRCRKALGGSW